MQLHRDLVHRGVAGLGAWAAIAWQDRIVDGAVAQAGELSVVAERIRHLTLGLEAARSQWRRRVPDEPQAAIPVLAPILRRLPTSAGSTALEELAGRGSWLTPALLSSAARRMLRPRGPVARGARGGAIPVSRLVGAAATRCPPPSKPPPGQDEMIERAADPVAGREVASIFAESASSAVAEAFAAIDESRRRHVAAAPTDEGVGLGGAPGATDADLAGLVINGFGGGTHDGVPGATGTHDAVPDPDRERLAPAVASSSTAIVDAVAASLRGDECRAFEREVWQRVVATAVAGIDPCVARPVVVDRVLGGVTGLREPELAAPDVAPELDIPLWSFLRDETPDWLLPGAGTLPVDSVLAMASNQEFVDAFLIGANQQALAELRRRNMAVTAGWTPLRRFWQRISEDGSRRETDIEPVLDLATGPPRRPLWPEASELGDSSHQRGTSGPLFVIVLHTELFRRYPATQVYLVSNIAGTDFSGEPPPVGDPGSHVAPILSGAVHPELVFFGFPRPPSAAADHWLVLEEPPPGFRFRAPTAAEQALTSGADYAAATLEPPIRAFFGGFA
jgi:hypothetical protein